MIATVLILGGCTASQAGSPAPGASTAPTAVAPTASPPPSPSPSVGASVEASPSPIVIPSPSPLPAVVAAQPGAWSSLAWIDAGNVIPMKTTNLRIEGWSRGFVALEQTGGSDENGNDIPIVIQASASRDGIHWMAPMTLDTDGLVGPVEIVRIVEGPSGLLALGYPFGDTCGGPEVLVALWTSPDGRQWDRVPFPKDFRTGQVLTIAGGSAGYIAFGNRADRTTQATWTSRDGRSWTSRPLPRVSSGTLVLDGATSFSGGFVLAGAVLGEGECGGPAHLHAATWWSADGAAWTRSSLPDSLTAADATLSVGRLSDRVALVTETSASGSTRRAWTSTDGRTWTVVHAPAAELSRQLVGDGRHAALVWPPDSGAGGPTVLAIGEDGTVATVAQTGSGPTSSDDAPGWATYAVGPTGIVVTSNDGTRVWLGVPS